MHIKIGDVETLKTEKWEIIPDDRQTRIDTIGGKVVQDFGYVKEGESYTCSVTVSAAGWEILEGYWHNRQFVPVRDVSGEVISVPLRPVVKKHGYVEHYERERGLNKKYYRADIEFWRV